MTLNKSYSENKVAIVAPIVFGGAIFLSAILSSLFLKKKYPTCKEWVYFYGNCSDLDNLRSSNWKITTNSSISWYNCHV